MAKLAEWPGALKIVEISFKQIMSNSAPMWFFVGTYTAITITSMLLQGSTSIFDKNYQSYADAIVLIFSIPLINYAFAIAKGKTISINEFMQFSIRKLLFLIVTSMIVVLIVLGSLLLLIFPVIFTLAWFAQAPYALVDKDLNPLEALKESKRISKDHKKKVWGILGVSILMSLLASVAVIVPFIGVAAIAFASTVSTVAAVNLYMWLNAAASKTSK